jgi:hypothetical protein
LLGADQVRCVQREVFKELRLPLFAASLDRDTRHGFVEMKQTLKARAEQIDELFKERRTVRTFKSERLDRDLLREIVGYAVYAPAHSHTLRAIICDDPELIQCLDQAVMRFNRRLYNILYRPNAL